MLRHRRTLALLVGAAGLVAVAGCAPSAFRTGGGPVLPGGGALNPFVGGPAPLTMPIPLPEQSGTTVVTVPDAVPYQSLTSAETLALAQSQAQTQMQATGVHRCPFGG